jgi:hypothetical protein
MRNTTRSRPSVRDAARTSRRDLRILLLIAGVAVVILLAARSGSISAADQGPPDEAVSEQQLPALREFNPSEEISADQAIAFPVDI